MKKIWICAATMKRIIFILCVSLIAICYPIPTIAVQSEVLKTTKTTKKTTGKTISKAGKHKNATTRLLATFTVDGNQFQLLTGDKVKCLTNPHVSGSYKKKIVGSGGSSSTTNDVYFIDLLDGDALISYMIFKDDDDSDWGWSNKIYEVWGGSDSEWTIDYDPRNVRVVVREKSEIIGGRDKIKYLDFPDGLKAVGKVKWIKR